MERPESRYMSYVSPALNSVVGRQLLVVQSLLRLMQSLAVGSCTEYGPKGMTLYFKYMCFILCALKSLECDEREIQTYVNVCF